MRILVLCTGNSARSQMAEGFLRSFDDRLEVHSAGTAPALAVNPHAVEVMREAGIDLSRAWPKSVDKFLGEPFEFVITVCGDADRNCPAFMGRVRKRVHLGFPDPALATGSPDEVRAVFRSVRDQERAELHRFYEAEIEPLLHP
jgi:arsenate reductase